MRYLRISCFAANEDPHFLWISMHLFLCPHWIGPSTKNHFLIACESPVKSIYIIYIYISSLVILINKLGTRPGIYQLIGGATANPTVKALMNREMDVGLPGVGTSKLTCFTCRLGVQCFFNEVLV